MHWEIQRFTKNLKEVFGSIGPHLALPLAFILFIVLPWILSPHLTTALVHKEVFRDICHLVEERFYQSSEELRQWGRECHQAALMLPRWSSRDEFIQSVQNHLNQMRVSHLDIYSPPERKRVWEGQGLDTGIRARWVEGALVVFEVLEGSPAERVGVRPGDWLKILNGEPLTSAWTAETQSGVYGLRRGAESLSLNILAEELKVDSQPTLKEIAPQAGLLRISSFRSEYFLKEHWLELISQLPQFDHLVIDVRGNLGGNFVALLRGLSPFFCEPTRVGYILQPRWPEQESAWVMLDEADDFVQLEQLGYHQKIALETFADYGCYKGKVTVLMDSWTKSVAEIFAQSFFLRDRTRVWGTATSGDVVLAVWYGLERLGSGYSLSIPEAVFETIYGLHLEGRGVWPEQTLFYEFVEAVQGQDSWLLRALE